jgi:PAS domain S-box-containing protein
MAELSDLRLILEEVLDAVMELQQADFGDVQLYDAGTATLRIVAHRGLDQAFLDYFESVDASDTSAWGLALRSGHHIIIEDVDIDPGFAPHRGIAASTGFRGVQAMPLYDRTSGKPIGMLSTRFRQPYRPTERELRLTDLFARQAADVIGFRLDEQRLRDSEEHLRLALEGGHIGTWEWEPASGLLKADDNHRALFGLPPEDLRQPMELYWSRMMPEEFEPAIEKGKEALRTGADIEVERRIIRQGGEVRWMYFRGRPKAGSPGSMIGISFDITERKRTESALRESEARLLAAVDLVKLGRYSWDPQNNELQWDETIKAMWGLPPDAAVDYDLWLSAVPPEDVQRIEAAIGRSTDPLGDGVYDVEYRVIGINDGVERWVATRGQTNFENGRAVSFYGVAIDVTDRKRVEADLERRVEVRTRELAVVNRQLRSQIEQREIAEAVVQQLQRLDAIGQITSGVAHDFNNLLSVILTNARLLLRKELDPDDREGVDLILAAAERGAKLTAQLLAFSRKQRLEPQAVDLNAKIEGMIELLGVTLGGSVNLKTALEPHLHRALVDPIQIELIILNLAINARDAMQAGGTLTLQTFNTVVETEPRRQEEPSPGTYVSLAVNDTGVGIPDEVLPRIFEPFFTTKAPGKGSGLGLAQVFGVAKQSGGGVRVETRLGEGTSVTVYLPRAGDAEGDLDDAQGQAKRSSRAVPWSTVLVVDDDKAVLRSTQRMLEFLGHAAVSAGSGAEALALLAGHPEVGLVLADYAMPQMNGVELARGIEAGWPELPVVLVTGHDDLDALQMFSESRILHKPYTEGDLAEIIKVNAGLRLSR